LCYVALWGNVSPKGQTDSCFAYAPSTKKMCFCCLFISETIYSVPLSTPRRRTRNNGRTLNGRYANRCAKDALLEFALSLDGRVRAPPKHGSTANDWQDTHTHAHHTHAHTKGQRRFLPVPPWRLTFSLCRLTSRIFAWARTAEARRGVGAALRDLAAVNHQRRRCLCDHGGGKQRTSVTRTPITSS
jgi:hypothetical protein